MFNNKQNEILRDEKGKIHWISRSVAVVSVVIWKDKFLILKRGLNVSNSKKWCSPCGYLDWNESAAECAIREIYEETGINLRNYKISGLESPYELVTEPNVNWKQDIAIHFKIIIDSETEPEYDLSIVDPGETLDIKWITADEIVNYDFAFKHDRRIKKCITH
jgi:8-oxo-dGTP pyrophosphatase MutT (NUDIX family)